MKKENSNRRKAAIGAVLAAGVTTGVISACASNEAKPEQSNKPDVELTAADKVVVDGQEIDSTEMMSPDSVRNVVRPMYGVRQRPIRLLYGPRPKPFPEAQNGMQAPDAIERQVMEVVSSTLRIDPRYVQNSSNLYEDYKITQQQKAQLKQALEEYFEINIFDETFNVMRTVGDLVNCVTVMVNN